MLLLDVHEGKNSAEKLKNVLVGETSNREYISVRCIREG